MKRRIINIDRDKCNGCGACASACHEGAIEMRDGKAYLAKEDHCDGLGDCLPACPTGAITFEEREAPAYNEEAVRKTMAERSEKQHQCSCPGNTLKQFSRAEPPRHNRTESPQSQLMQWPCQIKLVPINAPYFENADLLIAADCTAFAYGNLHNEFMRDHITLIGCPKLDGVNYAEKLSEIISRNNIRSIKVLRMEVPCCGGIEMAVDSALRISGKQIPTEVVIITTDGKILR